MIRAALVRVEETSFQQPLFVGDVARVEARVAFTASVRPQASLSVSLTGLVFVLLNDCCSLRALNAILAVVGGAGRCLCRTNETHWVGLSHSAHQSC